MKTRSELEGRSGSEPWGEETPIRIGSEEWLGSLSLAEFELFEQGDEHDEKNNWPPMKLKLVEREGM